jgi:hypothetical protein
VGIALRQPNGSTYRGRRGIAVVKRSKGEGLGED